MRVASYFLPTYKEKPKDVVIKSHELMIRAGLIRKLSAGFYNYLPFGLRALKKIEKVVREEMEHSGALEFLCSSFVSREILETSGRWSIFREELFRLKDSQGVDFGIAPTHEETFTEIASSYMTSYKNFPLTLFQISEKYRDEIRPRYGVIRCREFRMKDAYSFDLDEESLEKSYQTMRLAYSRVFERLGLDFAIVKADSGAMGGSTSEEYMLKSEVGENDLAFCENCGYAANTEKADAKIEILERVEKPLKKIRTEGLSKPKEVANFLGVKTSYFLKSLLYKIIPDNEPSFDVMIVLRGDFDLNETKLSNYFDGARVSPLTAQDIYLLGLPIGYIGPYDLREVGKKIRLLWDISVDKKTTYYIGGNEKDYHYEGFLPERDREERVDHTQEGNFYLVGEGCFCPECGGKLYFSKGLELGHIFKLGMKYTNAFDFRVTNKSGELVTPLMGCYGIGIDRVLAAVIENHHDEKGLRWTKESTPFDVMCLLLPDEDKGFLDFSNTLYEELKKRGYSVLYDDSSERPGVKFNRADLLGIPIQLVLGMKSFKNGEIEVKNRQSAQSFQIPIEKFWDFFQKQWDSIL